VALRVICSLVDGHIGSTKMLDEPTDEPTTETLRPLLLGIENIHHRGFPYGFTVKKLDKSLASFESRREYLFINFDSLCNNSGVKCLLAKN
jgi:hypothetical protein